MNRTLSRTIVLLMCTAAGFLLLLSIATGEAAGSSGRHQLAVDNEDLFTLSTLFIARTVNTRLSSDSGIEEAIAWCRHNGILKVYLETFRNGELAEREVILKARDRFREAGFEVAGCVTLTDLASPGFEKQAEGLVKMRWFACYTSEKTQNQVQDIFEITAGLFDEIIIDDFFATLCVCEQCTAARGSMDWPEYRSGLLAGVSRDRILAPAKAVNPDCRITIKYPNWYDHYYSRGYDLAVETELYDAIFTGTETREPRGPASNPQYGGFVLMQLLNAAGGSKNRGGWFDYIETKADTYLEQARQTVLGGARELMLFRYDVLAHHAEGKELMGAFNAELPALFELARIIRGKTVRGIAIPRPMGSGKLDTDPEILGGDKYIGGYLGMLGLPVVPVRDVGTQRTEMIGTRHLLDDPDMLETFLQTASGGTPVAITSGLAEALGPQAPSAPVLPTGSKEDLMGLSRKQLNKMRDSVLWPFGISLDAPSHVSLYLFDEDILILENFRNLPVTVRLGLEGAPSVDTVLEIPASGQSGLDMIQAGEPIPLVLKPRSLVVLALSRD